MRQQRRTTRSTRAGAGVRGGVEYREISEQYVSDKQYPPALFVLVNSVLVLLTLAILAALLFSLTPLSRVLPLDASRCEVVYTLELYDYSGVLSSGDLVGKTLCDVTEEEPLGDILSATTRTEIRDTVSWQEGWEKVPSGVTPEESAYPVKVLTLTVRLTARHREGEGYFTADGRRLAVGERLSFRVEDTLAAGTLVTVDLMEENGQ